MTGVELKPADLVLVRGTDWVSREIEEVTHSTYSHVALVVNPSLLIEAQGFRRVGYQKVDAYKGMSDVYRNNLLIDRERERVVQNARTHLGQRYDYLLIALEFLRYTLGLMIPKYEHHSVICSTLVADAYRGLLLDPCPGINNPSPADLAKSPLFRKVGSF